MTFRSWTEDDLKSAGQVLLGLVKDDNRLFIKRNGELLVENERLREEIEALKRRDRETRLYL